MQPHDQRTRRHGARLARARMFMAADLAWLPGLPLRYADGGLTWLSWPRGDDAEPEEMTVTRQMLQRAVYTRNQLVVRYPRVLPRLVDNVAWWQEGTDRIFGWLRDARRNAQAPPRSLLDAPHRFSPTAQRHARGLASASPAVRQLLADLTWTCYLWPSEFTRLVRWLAGAAEELGSLAGQIPPAERRLALLRISELVRRDGPRGLHVLLELLGDPRVWNQPLQDARQTLADTAERFGPRHRRKKWKPTHFPRNLPKQPPARAGTELLAFLQRVLRMPPASRKRVATLCPLLLSSAPLESWEQFWRQWHAVGAWARTGRQSGRKELQKAEQRLLRRRFDRLAEARPQEMHLPLVCRWIERLSAPTGGRLFSLLLPLLRALPALHGGGLLRPAFCGALLELHDDYPDRARGLLRELNRQRAALAAGDLLDFEEELLSGWESNVPGWYGVLDDLAGEGFPRSAWRRALESMAAIGRRLPGELNMSGRDGIVLALARVSGSTEQVLARFQALTRRQKDLSWIQREAACLAALVTDDPGAFAEVYTQLPALSTAEVESVRGLHDEFVRAGWPGLAAGLIADKRSVALQRLAGQRVLLGRLGGALDPPLVAGAGRSPDWARAYPPELRPALAVLDAVVPDARAVAREKLHGVVPDPRRLEREIAALQTRLEEAPDDARLRARLQRLAQRRAAPPTASPSVVRKHRTRLERMLRRIVFEHWERAVTDALTKQMQSRFGDAADLACLADRGNVRAVAGVLSETGGTGRLALRLLQRRLGPRPWHLHAEPPNQAFLREMTGRGLRIDAWLDDAQCWTLPEVPGSRVYFSSDPLEVFQMGAFFDTCLSPGDFNFFSVFANAADVNKRVLFARDGRGTVVGRCLFALTDTGNIVTFYVYAHEAGAGFDELVPTIAAELAARMGTVVAGDGVVRPLVAERWYDDGIASRCGIRLPEPDTDAARAWERIPSAGVRAAVGELLAPAPLSAVTVPVVLALPAFQQRPELILPLLPEVLAVAHWPRADLVRAVTCCHAAGAQAATRHLLTEHLVPHLRADLDVDTARVMIGIDAPVALRLLRQTRDPGVRDDHDDQPWRRELIAEALDKLARPNRAAALRATLTR